MELKEIAKLKEEPKMEGCLFPSIGWNWADHRRVFAFSNCVITERGIDSRSCSEVEGLNLHVSAEFSENGNDRQKTLELLNILNVRPQEMLPLFLCHVAALLNEPLSRFKKAPALTIWLSGQSGSGKTSLAKALGTILNTGGEDYESITAAYTKSADVVDLLSRYHGLVFVLDDVKGESAGRKERRRQNVDICVRTTEGQRIVETFRKEQRELLNRKLDVGCIITGELSDNPVSTAARMLYIDVENFVNEEDASEALGKLQKNPGILNDVVAAIIRFLCVHLEDERYLAELAARKEQFWQRGKKLFFGSNRSRLANTLSSLELSLSVTVDFMQSCGVGDSYDLKKWQEEMEAVCRELMKRSSKMVTKEDQILLDSFLEILGDLKIQRACRIYDMYREEAIMPQPFVVQSQMDGIFVPDTNWILGKKDESPKGALILRWDRLQEKLTRKMVELLRRYRYNQPFSLLVDPGRLRRAGLIYCERRPDGFSNNVIYYPVAEADIYGGGEEIEEKACVCLNLQAPIFEDVRTEFSFDAERDSVMLLDEINEREYGKIQALSADIGTIARAVRKIKVMMEVKA